MKNYLCIDIGGTAIKYGLYNRTGQKVTSFASDQTNNAIAEQNISNTLRKKIQELKHLGLAGVCISSAGVVDPEAGKIIYSGYTIPNYTGTALKEMVETEFQLPCEVENDVNAACLGEYWQGALKGTTSGICLTVGTGVGGALLIDGQIFHGAGYTAGEIGYMTINGARFQDVAATSALVQRVRMRKGLPLDGKEIFHLAEAGDPICIEEIEVLIQSLTTGLVNIIYLLNPERIVLGGAIMAQEAYLKPRIQKAMDLKIQDDQFKQTELHFAQLKNDAGMVGALYNFIKRQ
ncbi:hypothetical protein RU97_GL001319 [Enterococcus canis]|uniref:ROK family protein n=1 Tax=Enterococcus canis TaxID=214095 RepID=A0A1L8RFY8_9ENTE|nr:ROK family protein [Enterococcus canis]OJG18701.1 hypothetical protein RU97_GL001319 [Enterococcus canis]